MGLYLLKAGTHTTGSGEDAAYYTAKDPKNNIVESDQKLDEIHPEKFQKYDGPAPAKESAKKQAQVQPPKPPDDMDRIEAEVQSGSSIPQTPEVLKERAKRLREMADALEKSASDAKSKQEKAKAESEEDEEEETEEETSKAQRQKKAQEEKSKSTAAQKTAAQKAKEEAEEEAQPQPSKSEEEKKAQQEDAKLEQMTLPELRALAHRENVQAHAGMKKEEVLEAVRKARKKSS